MGSELEINLGSHLHETGLANQGSEYGWKIEKRRVPRIEPTTGNRLQLTEVMGNE